MNVCLITTSQPSANPRLVKEADALTEIGARVHVIGAQWADWAEAHDAVLLAGRRWTCDILEWRRHARPERFWKSRTRHAAARLLTRVPGAPAAVVEAALSRIGPDLHAAAARQRADLYIAHNLGALPVALEAAATQRARAGFDAEDFHSGQVNDPRAAALTQRAERDWLPRCDYVTAASAGIADAYATLCGIPRPVVVLNVFPRCDRPSAPRPTALNGPLTLYWFSQLIGRDRGLEDIVRAMGRLQGQVELHLRGAWQQGYEEALRAIARNAGVAQHQIVAHPASPADEMVRLAADYHIGLALEPSVTVNNDIAVSNKLFTYLLAGSAVIATRTKGHLSVLPNIGSAVRSYESGNVEQLAAILRSWSTDRASLAAARAAAWSAADSRFNWDVEKAAFLDAAGVLRAAA